jgi:hypothetical protein
VLAFSLTEPGAAARAEMSPRAAAAPAALSPGTRSMLAWLMVAYIATLGTEAAIRWVLNNAGIDFAIYLKDLFPLSASAVAVYHAVSRGVDSRNTAALAWAFLWLIFVGLASDLPVAQVMFGLKVWVPLAVGFVLVDSGAVSALNRPRLWGALWALLCIGIFLNYFHRTPWAGLTAQIGDASVEINRDWTAYGRPRVSGFSRSSYDGAIIVLLLHVYLMSAWRSAWLRVMLIGVSTLAIALTTSKGALGALFCTFLFLPLLWSRGSLVDLMRAPSLVVLVCFAAFGLFAPALSTQFTAPTFVPFSIEAKLFASLADRGWETWPYAFDLLRDWQMVLGRGMGGIGSAQYQFEPALACPADNMFVYLFVTGGVFGAALYALPIVTALRLRFEWSADRMIFMYLVAIYSYGMTASMIDNAPLALVIGGLTAALLRRTVAASLPETS